MFFMSKGIERGACQIGAVLLSIGLLGCPQLPENQRSGEQPGPDHEVCPAIFMITGPQVRIDFGTIEGRDIQVRSNGLVIWSSHQPESFFGYGVLDGAVLTWTSYLDKDEIVIDEVDRSKGPIAFVVERQSPIDDGCHLPLKDQPRLSFEFFGEEGR